MTSGIFSSSLSRSSVNEREKEKELEREREREEKGAKREGKNTRDRAPFVVGKICHINFMVHRYFMTYK